MDANSKTKKFEDSESHKNGTVTGSEHKMYSNSKDSVLKKDRRQSDSQAEDTRKVDENPKNIIHEEEKHIDEVVHKKARKCPSLPDSWKNVMNKILQNNFYVGFMMIITVYALFGDDFRLLFSPKSGDPVFWGITVGCMAWFGLEVIMASLAQKDYFLNFYFWLDFVATVSLITDIGWIYNELVGGGEISTSNASSASGLARAGRGARIGTRAGRIVRLVRLIRIVKLYKHAHKALEKEDGEGISAEELKQIQSQSAKDLIPKESHVGKHLSDLTTRRVIVIVLIMMFSVPLLSLDTYKEEPNHFEYGLQVISAFATGSNGREAAIRSFVEESGDTRNPVLSMNIEDVEIDIEEYRGDVTDLDDLRTIEVLVGTYGGEDYVSVHDNRKNVKIGAGLGIGRTLFICLVLTVAAMWFSSSTNSLVVGPIESMIEKVKKIAKNPLEAAQEEENQALALEKFFAEERKKGKKKKSVEKEAPFETVILENTIVKIGALLAIGFGEAGSHIIAKNMERSGEVDPMLPGVKCVAFFGFWDIRQFTDTTEILQEEVMVFVNEIGEIVHAVVDSFAGAANKNIGDAFLLVWKLPEEETEVNTKLKNIVAKKSAKAGYIAEMAMLAFLKCFANINKSRKLYKYRSYEKLNARMPNYSVKMGFGLHVGWAIEGAIGSDFKIDASYLSPNVKLSDELEASTKVYGTPLLMSGYVYDLMSDQVKAKCRHLDTVKITGYSSKFRLFTWDIDFNLVELEPELKKELSPFESKLKRVKARLKRDRDKKSIFEGSIQLSNKFELDQDMVVMRQPFTQEFYEVFSEGFKHYIDGKWAEARESFERIEGIRGSPDGPTLTLLSIMEEHNFRAPADWEGWRELD